MPDTEPKPPVAPEVGGEAHIPPWRPAVPMTTEIGPDLDDEIVITIRIRITDRPMTHQLEDLALDLPIAVGRAVIDVMVRHDRVNSEFAGSELQLPTFKPYHSTLRREVDA